MPRLFRLICLLLLAATVSACANQKPTHSGFLKDYSKLKPETATARVLEEKPTSSALALYTNVYIAPVITRLGSTVKPKDAQDLAALTAKALRTELSKQWKIVGSPGPRTITIRSALTAVHKSNPAANVVLTVVAVPLANGGLSGEAEFVNGRRRIGAISWAGEGTFSPMGYYVELGHARELTASFAKAVAKELARKKSMPAS